MSRSKEKRKIFRLSYEEEKQIKRVMESEGETNFSDFVRRKILVDGIGKNSYFNEQAFIETIVHRLSLQTQIQSVEKIYERVLEVSVLSQKKQTVSPQDFDILLNCVRKLLEEIDRVIPLSQDFKNRYME